MLYTFNDDNAVYTQFENDSIPQEKKTKEATDRVYVSDERLAELKLKSSSARIFAQLLSEEIFTRKELLSGKVSERGSTKESYKEKLDPIRIKYIENLTHNHYNLNKPDFLNTIRSAIYRYGLDLQKKNLGKQIV